jgi:hypothetical protein
MIVPSHVALTTINGHNVIPKRTHWAKAEQPALYRALGAHSLSMATVNAFATSNSRLSFPGWAANCIDTGRSSAVPIGTARAGIASMFAQRRKRPPARL